MTSDVCSPIFLFTSFFLDIDECKNVDQCENGGTCTNNPGSFICDCKTGWEGKKCETGLTWEIPIKYKPIHNGY